MKKKSFGSELLFLIGFPRSGTTLLLRLLKNHPKIFVNPRETCFFTAILNDKNINWDLSQQKNYQKICKRILNLPVKNYFPYLNQQQIVEILNNPNHDYADIYYQLITKSSKCVGEKYSYFLEKTPYHCTAVSRIIALYPEAKFIYITRDPKATIASFNKESFCFFSNNFYSNVITWVDGYRLSRDQVRLINPENLFTLRYEDLVDYPEKEVLRLYKFLKLDQIGLLTLEKSSDKFQGLLNNIRNTERISQDYKDEWRKTLSLSELKIIEHYSRQFINEYGYKIIFLKVNFFRLMFFRLMSFPRYCLIRLIQFFQILRIGNRKPISSSGRYVKEVLTRLITGK
ncbi:MAG: sulfotransferase [Candidatus Omnitrophica bacterium]|nr:sulfotransferase [Candidatus Omnitrophota bacterium]